eukprot:gene7431-7495_t
MSHRSFKFFGYLLVLTFLLGCKAGYCQVRNSPLSSDSLRKAGLQKADTAETDQFNKLEKAIDGKKALLQTSQQLLLIKQRAIKSHDDIMLARSLYELMKISDLRTEDSLYFKNSAFMDTLLNDRASSATLKAIFYVLRAQRINNFDHRQLRFNRAAYRSITIPVDYAALTTDQLDSIWTRDLTAALAHTSSAIDVKRLLWISSNPDIFLFEPQFADLVLSEYVNQAALKNYYNFNQGVSANQWPSLPSNDFRKKLDSIALRDKSISILAGYQRWLSFNKNNDATAAFIESLARKYIFSFTSSDSLSHRSYINYLRAQTESPYSSVIAHSVYQLCLLWNEEGNKYFNNSFGYSYITSSTFDKRYQYLPDSALRLFDKNKALMSRYPQFNRILILMAKQIQAPGLSVSMNDKFIPQQDIPIKASYKNTGTLYYHLIRISSREPSGHAEVIATAELIKRKPVISGVFALPLPPDHNKHAVYLKLPALPAGHYRLLFNYAELKADGSVYNIPFQVTSIAAINSDERIYIFDRKAGAPLAGTAVKVFKKGASVVSKAQRMVNKKGYIMVPGNIADSIAIAYKGDTLGYPFAVEDYDRNEGKNIYDKDEYNDLVDFYDDKLTMDIFTDRSIYRPGQTVHYKIILLTRNPKTGEPVLFNRQNLGGGIFKNRMAAWLKKKHTGLTLSDPFNHNVDSVQMIPNDFGSFAGSFVLPKTAATGAWNISGNPDQDYQNEGRFRVEEYKRPTIELSMEKQKKMLRPGEPFIIKLKLRSFNGGELGNIPIKYKVSRSGVLPFSKLVHPVYNSNYFRGQLSDTIAYTNEKGELNIPVNDTLLKKYTWGDDDNDNYNYTVDATATDAAGETTEINENVNISSRPVHIGIQLNKIYDRQSLPIVSVNTTADFESVTGRKVAIKIYAVSDPMQTRISLKNTDQWYYPEAEWNKWFPALANPKPSAPQRILVLDTLINTAMYGKLVLPKDKLNTGFYELTADCRADDGTLIGRFTYNFKVFDRASGTAPGDDLDYMPVNTAKPGELLTWYNFNPANTYSVYQVLYPTGKKRVIKNIYSEVSEQRGLQRFTFHVPTNATGNLVFTRIYVSDNQIIKKTETVYLYKAESLAPEIIIEKYRKVMAPGDEETFMLSVKTKNINTAAEIMTTLYDASLDKLNAHEWAIPNRREYHPDATAQWPYSLYLQQQAGNFDQSEAMVVMREIKNQQYGFISELNGKAAGVNITSASGLSEVVVVGYGIVNRLGSPGSASSIMIRGISSLADYKQPLIIVDGEIYTGGLDKLNPQAITQAMVLKGADASALYGSQAAEGVLIVSTKGPIVLPEAPEPVVKIRKNFNETAFFFPQVHAGTDGYYSFSFTMPESATERNWKILAHTKKARFAYLERKLQTQLNLMVQPNMPRLLYQGDKLNLHTRITNLDTINVAGKVNCKIEDAVTGEDLTAILLTNNQQAFSVNKKSSVTASFQLNVPAEQLNPLKIIVTAVSPGAADAEEHTIPVLSSKILVRQSIPVKFDQQAVTTITPLKLPSDAQLFGIGLSIAQKPQATLINALPWLANYSYDCAEQTFNKINALATALRLMQKDTLAQKMFAQRIPSLEKEKLKDNPLPDEVAAEATPWLSLGNQATMQHQQLFKILDTITSKNSIEKHLERLYKLQQHDGGLSWFEGGKSNEYISAYVLAGFGRLKQQGWKLNGAPQKLTDHVNVFLHDAWEGADKQSLGQQALLIINTFKFNTTAEALYKKAQQQLETISQLAIQDNQNGIRWKDISDAEDLNTSAEETMALLAEAFQLSSTYTYINPGMVKWLLTTRQDQHWQTTKATAAAIDMLQKEQGGSIGGNTSLSAEIAGRHLYVSNDLLNGVPADFVTAQQMPSTITLQHKGANTNGAITEYYFAKPISLDTLNKAVRISKQFYSYDKNQGWIPFTNGIRLKTGDKVRVKLTIETSSRLKFVHISDPRAAAFEPADNNSGYQYNNGLGFYQSVKDTGLEIFTESVPRGISEITYEMIVAMNGEFTSGPARLQCMYQPAVTAYSKRTIRGAKQKGYKWIGQSSRF